MRDGTYTFEVTSFLQFMRQCRRLFEVNTNQRSLTIYDPETGSMKQSISTADVWCMTGSATQPTKLLIRLSGDHDDLVCEFDSDRDKTHFVKIMKQLAELEQPQNCQDSSRETDAAPAQLKLSRPSRERHRSSPDASEGNLPATRSSASPVNTRSSSDTRHEQSLQQGATDVRLSTGSATSREAAADELVGALAPEMRSALNSFGLLRNVRLGLLQVSTDSSARESLSCTRLDSRSPPVCSFFSLAATRSLFLSLSSHALSFTAPNGFSAWSGSVDSNISKPGTSFAGTAPSAPASTSCSVGR